MTFAIAINSWSGIWWSFRKHTMEPMRELNKIAHHLPIPVLQDIDKRITDWLASGGTENDPYIEQQLRFAKHFTDK
jgi:hypothetical protein